MTLIQHLLRPGLENPYRSGASTPVHIFTVSHDQSYAIDLNGLHEHDDVLAAFLPRALLEVRVLDGLAYSGLLGGLLGAFFLSPLLCPLSIVLSALVLRANKLRCGERLAERALAEPGIFIRMHQAGLVWRVSTHARSARGTYEATPDVINLENAA